MEASLIALYHAKEIGNRLFKIRRPCLLQPKTFIVLETNGIYYHKTITILFVSTPLKGCELHFTVRIADDA